MPEYWLPEITLISRFAASGCRLIDEVGAVRRCALLEGQRIIPLWLRQSVVVDRGFVWVRICPGARSGMPPCAPVLRSRWRSTSCQCHNTGAVRLGRKSMMYMACTVPGGACGTHWWSHGNDVVLFSLMSE